jgi:metal-dependent hydrolase (beta-lactamase superfamily II)
MSLSSVFPSTEPANWSTAWARFFTAGHRGKRPPYYACKLLLEKEKPGIRTGRCQEHSLVVNVEGLGGVLIVGCGHQPVPRLVERYDAAYAEPLYGIIGGVHFPIPEGRIKLGPLDVQRDLASGNGLFDPLTLEQVDAELAMLKRRNLGIIAVSGHDSSDEVIARVRERFGDAHRYIRVGEEIVVRSH